MLESGSSGPLLLVLDWASLASGNFRCQLFRVHLTSVSSTEDDLSLQLGDEPTPRAVFSRAVIASVSESKISTARPASRCRIRLPFIDADDVSFLSGISRNLMTAPPTTWARSR